MTVACRLAQLISHSGIGMSAARRGIGPNYGVCTRHATFAARRPSWRRRVTAVAATRRVGPSSHAPDRD